MYLKFRYQLGYETLVQEVSDSLHWRRFCRIPIDHKVPNSTTLIKARNRYDEAMIEHLNELLVKKLTEEKIIRHRKFRTDTTVVESDIHHPTYATLLQDGVRVITQTVNKIRQVASHATEGFIDQTDVVKRKVLSFAKVLRQRMSQSWDEVNKITQDVVEVVTGYAVYAGNPSDDDMLIPAVVHHQEIFGSVPHAVATDRGFGSHKNERTLQEEFGVIHVSTPFRGKKCQKHAELEQRLWYKNLQRFRQLMKQRLVF